MIQGVLVLDKPEGPTSHDMVRLVRRLLRTRQVGHTGTLDPMATGVLPVCVGRTTRLARFLSGSLKVYRATVRLGWETDTLDRTGVPTGPPTEVTVDRERVRSALEELTGRHLQTPPSYSAKRIDGVRAHRLARAGRPVMPDPVEVEIVEFRAVTAKGSEVGFEVTCSAGTYVRALARDLGRALGTGGHLAALRRLRSGEFDLAQARRPEELRGLEAEQLRAALIPPGELHLGMDAVRVPAHSEGPIAHGRPLEPGDWEGDLPAAGASCRVLGPGGELLAVAAVEPGPSGARLQPRVVLVRTDQDGDRQG